MNTKTKAKQTTIHTDSPMKDAIEDNKSLFKIPSVGDTIEGKVLGKESGVLYIDLGIIGTGVVYGAEYYKVQDQLKSVKPGDEIKGKLVELENEDGYRELSLQQATEEKSWKAIEKQKEEQESIEIKITDANKGGLMAKVGSLTGFLPVSQLAPTNYPRVEGGDKNKILQELKKFIGTKMQVHILDIDKEEGKLIFSEKAAEDGTIKEALGKYEVGDAVEGEITGVVDFGAFIKFDEILEGLIHISELDWSLVQDPRDVVKVGQKVQAKIVDIADDGRVSLSLKALKDNPWTKIEGKLKKGDKIEGEVTKTNSYGALVKLDEGLQGLVHISEFDTEEELKEKLKEGETYEFEVQTIDSEEYKISLKLAE